MKEGANGKDREAAVDEDLASDKSGGGDVEGKESGEYDDEYDEEDYDDEEDKEYYDEEEGSEDSVVVDDKKNVVPLNSGPTSAV